jgi:hypothetical protein
MMGRGMGARFTTHAEAQKSRYTQGQRQDQLDIYLLLILCRICGINLRTLLCDVDIAHIGRAGDNNLMGSLKFIRGYDLDYTCTGVMSNDDVLVSLHEIHFIHSRFR